MAGSRRMASANDVATSGAIPRWLVATLLFALKVPGKVVLQKEGRGKYVGVMLTVDWPYESGYWWGEGDWLIWTDETGWPPRYHGTGSEEYFNSGWCRFDRKAVSGFVVADLVERAICGGRAGAIVLADAQKVVLT